MMIKRLADALRGIMVLVPYFLSLTVELQRFIPVNVPFIYSVAS